MRAALACAAFGALAACTVAPLPGNGDGHEDVDAGFAPDAGPSDAGPLWEGTVDKDRSLVWTRADLLDDTNTLSLARVMTAAAGHLSTDPGTLLDAWLNRFATTAHSERAGPAQLAQQLHDTLGDDPSTWDLTLAPFKVTGVHNRVDLMGRFADGPHAGEAHCGQLRVSLASTDPIFRPFHLLFLFSQPARDGDLDDADGAPITCAQTALAWAQLSDLNDAEFLDAARAILDDGLVPVRFLLAESVELTVSPWEWRQWIPSGSAFDNPPLFEQVNVEGINAAGTLRDAFLTYVQDNAAALEARTLLLPEQFRSPSVRVVQGAPWVPLDLGGVASDSVRKNLEIVGCAGCHTADAEFVQTREDRTFSPFYTKELVARGALLQDILHHVPHAIPLGPLQTDPVLPP